jgi:hypothetical protein
VTGVGTGVGDGDAEGSVLGESPGLSLGPSDGSAELPGWDEDGAGDDVDPTATGAGVGPELPLSSPAPTPRAMPTARTTTTRTPAMVRFTRRIPADEALDAALRNPRPRLSVTRPHTGPHGPIRSGGRIAELAP